MQFTIEIEREEDGRFIAEVMEIPGVLTYGQTREEVEIGPTMLARISRSTGLTPDDL